MKDLFIADAHLDLAYNVFRGRDPTQPAAQQPVADGEVATVGLPELRAGTAGLICATIFCSPKAHRPAGYATAEQAHAVALQQLRWYQDRFDAGDLRPVKSPADLPQSKIRNPKSKIPTILLLEGGDPFRTSDDVHAFFDAGLRIVGLAWERTRMSGGTGHPGPLTDEGRAVVRAMDELRMIHDTSHLAEEAFWQLLDLTAGPVIASHSNCRAIVPGDRQMSDEMLKAITSRGGVIGMNFYDRFLMPPAVYKTRRCTFADLIAHIKHICDLVGDASHVALGTDMDGGLGRDDIPQELTTWTDVPRLADALVADGFSDADVRAIMGENWLGFFSRSLPS